MYNNIRWLCSGCVLERFVEYLDTKKQKTKSRILLRGMAQQINVFSQIFSFHLSKLISKLQGYGKKIIDSMFDIIKAFENKLKIFKGDVESSKLKYTFHV